MNMNFIQQKQRLNPIVALKCKRHYSSQEEMFWNCSDMCKGCKVPFQGYFTAKDIRLYTGLLLAFATINVSETRRDRISPK